MSSIPLWQAFCRLRTSPQAVSVGHSGVQVPQTHQAECPRHLLPVQHQKGMQLCASEEDVRRLLTEPQILAESRVEIDAG